MRDQVLHYFRSLPKSEPEQFNTALDLFRKSPGANGAYVRQLNAAGYSKSNLQNLLYDLQQLHSIKDVEKLPVKKEKNEGKVLSAMEQLKLYVINSGNTLALQYLKLVAEFPNLEKSDKTDAELLQFIVESSSQIEAVMTDFVKENTITEESLPISDLAYTLREELSKIEFPETIKAKLESPSEKNVQESSQQPEDKKTEPLKFRDEYPFLKEPHCPSELKILATDKITHFRAYQDAHEKLQLQKDGKLELTDEEITALAAAAVEHFEAGEKIKAELDYYQENKEVLGQHPVFEKLALEREVQAMSKEQCLAFIKGTPSYISKQNKLIKEAESEDRKLKLEEKITLRNKKLNLVNEKMGA